MICSICKEEVKTNDLTTTYYYARCLCGWIVREHEDIFIPEVKG